MFNYLGFKTISLQTMSGLGGPPPEISEYPAGDISIPTGNTSIPTGNTSIPKGPNFVPYYPNGVVKLLALNYSAISMLPYSIVNRGQSCANLM
jgi:hypothetical protein